jgi:hypothetical protein
MTIRANAVCRSGQTRRLDPRCPARRMADAKTDVVEPHPKADGERGRGRVPSHERPASEPETGFGDDKRNAGSRRRDSREPGVRGSDRGDRLWSLASDGPDDHARCRLAERMGEPAVKSPGRALIASSLYLTPAEESRPAVHRRGAPTPRRGRRSPVLHRLPRPALPGADVSPVPSPPPASSPHSRRRPRPRGSEPNGSDPQGDWSAPGDLDLAIVRGLMCAALP